MIKQVLAWLGIGTLGVVGVVLLFAVLFAIGTFFTALIVALVWNWINLHELFDAPALSFWQVVGVAVLINILRSIFSGSGSSVSVNR